MGPTVSGRARVLAAIIALAAATGEAQTPAKRAFALPVEVDFDFGASNGNAVINRYLPLFAVPLGETWQLQNLTLAVVANAPGGVPGRPGNPEPVPGGSVFGLGDLTNVVFVARPADRLVWGIGAGLTLPIATDARLGSGKWSAGPAFRIAYRPGRWNLGALVANLGSFAGDAERGNVHQLLVRALIRRQLGGGWYLTSNPIITANWNASSGERWLVPLGGGLGKRVETGGWTFALAVHGYWNAIRPEGAPHSLFRLDFVVPIPTGSLRR